MKTLTADEAAALIREMRANRIAFANGQIAQKKDGTAKKLLPA